MAVSAKKAKQWASEHVKGLMTTMYTPFCGKDGDDIDYDALRKLVRYSLVDLKRDGIYVCGTVGEFWALTKDERKKVAEVAIDEAKKINPKAIRLVMTSCLPVKDAVELTQHAQQIGADLAVVLIPYYEAVGAPGAYEYYKYISERTDMPLGLYNHPGTGFILSPEACADIYNKLPGICVIKNIADMVQPGHSLALHQLAPKMVIWEGDFRAAGVGGHMKMGFVSPVIMGMADYLVDCPAKKKMPYTEHWKLLMEGKLTEAVEQYYTSGLAEVMAAQGLRGSSPLRPGWHGHWASGVKYMASLLGLPVGDYPHSRPPQIPFPEETKQRVRNLYIKAGFIEP